MEQTSRTQLSFVVLASLLIGGGIISVIAANWYLIPDSVKLLADYGLLALTAFGANWCYIHKKDLAFEGFIVAFSILILATIGLDAQVFHLSGKPYMAGLLWTVLAMGPITYCRMQLGPHMIIGAFIGSLLWLLLDSPATRVLFEQNLSALGLTIPLAIGMMTLMSRTQLGEVAFTRAFRQWIVYSGVLALYLTEYIPYINYRHENHTRWEAFALGWILVVVTAFLVNMDLHYKKIQKYLLWTGLGLFTVAMHLPLLLAPRAVTAVFTICTCIVFSFYMATQKQWRGFNFLFAIVVLRFFGLFIEALGGLAMTGAGLIGAGVMILGGMWMWRKGMPAFRTWVEEQIK